MCEVARSSGKRKRGIKMGTEMETERESSRGRGVVAGANGHHHLPHLLINRA